MKIPLKIPLYYNNVFICNVEKVDGRGIVFPFRDTKKRLRNRTYLLGIKYGRWAYIYEKEK